MSLKLSLDSLSVDSFSTYAEDTAASTGIECTHFRDCTYPPMCPATDTGTEVAVAGKPLTIEPGCTLPEICHQDTTVPL